MPPPPEYRTDPLSGDLTHVVANRQDRPNRPAGGCPFCVGGVEAPAPYDVKSFPNRWPPLPGGRAEIVLYSPDHNDTFASLGVAGARLVIDLWADRTQALGARPDVAYVLIFENRGEDVGATIAHPHGQIYAFGIVPPQALAELQRGFVGDALGPAATGPGDERLVAAAGEWRAWVPEAARYPYELVVAPVEPVPDLPALAPDERDDLAAVLVDVIGRYDALFAMPMPYMLWVHQRPTDGGDWPDAWVHVHLAPLLRAPGTPRYVAAGELGSGIYFNPVDPLNAVASLRGAR